MEKIIFTAEESGFIVEAEGKKLRVSYDEFFGDLRGCEVSKGEGVSAMPK